MRGFLGLSFRDLRWVMRPARPDDPIDGPEFPAATVIRDALHVAAATDKPIRVVDGGRLAGVVDRAQILEAVAGPEEAGDGRPVDGTPTTPTIATVSAGEAGTAR